MQHPVSSDQRLMHWMSNALPKDQMSRPKREKLSWSILDHFLSTVRACTYWNFKIQRSWKVCAKIWWDEIEAFQCLNSGIPPKGLWDLSQKMLRIMAESHACFCISDSIQSFLQRKEELLETLRTILGCKLLSKFCNTVILGTVYMYQFNTWCFTHSYSKSHVLVHCSIVGRFLSCLLFTCFVNSIAQHFGSRVKSWW